jgi:hypothetical protein
MRALYCALLVTARLAACALEGTVTDATTGKPLPGVRVFARPQGEGSLPAYLRRSDVDGRYCFERLAPGMYRVIAQHAGYLDQLYGALPGGRDGIDLAVKADETQPPAHLKLSLRTIVSGVVLHADGQPAAGAGVSIYRKIQTRRGPDFDDVEGKTADDRGMFRFADLTPGVYYLSAEKESREDDRLTFRNAQGEPIREKEATTYYAAAAGFADARPISVQPGRDVAGLTITLRKTPLRRISGRLSTVETDTYLGLSSHSDDVHGGSIRVRPDGSFERSDVMPGRYTLEWQGSNGLLARQEVDLTHGDVEGLVVEAQRRFTVPLVVKAEDGAPPAPPVVATLFSIPDGETFIVHGLEFRQVLPGAYRLTAAVIGRAYYLKRVTIDGKVQAPERLELAGAPSGPIELTFSTKVARVTGRVEGRAAAAVTVLLFDPGDGDAEQRTTADQNGAFHIDRIKPGKYRLYAIEGFDESAWGSAELAAALPSVEINLAEGESREATVPLTRATEWKAAVERYAK